MSTRGCLLPGCRMHYNVFMSAMRNDLNYLHHSRIERWYENLIPQPSVKAFGKFCSCRDSSQGSEAQTHVMNLCPAHFTLHIDGLVQDCSISSAVAMEILRSCTKPSTCHRHNLPDYLSIWISIEALCGKRWQPASNRPRRPMLTNSPPGGIYGATGSATLTAVLVAEQHRLPVLFVGYRLMGNI